MLFWRNYFLKGGGSIGVLNAPLLDPGRVLKMVGVPASK